MNTCIVLNRMYAGSYLSAHLGHEVINMFQADNGKHYLYLNAKGNLNDNGLNAKHMLLVMHIGGKKVEVLALAKNLKVVPSAKCKMPRNLTAEIPQVKDAQRTYILGEAKDEQGNEGGIHYGGIPLLDLFDGTGQQNVFVSYEVDKGLFYKPKKRLILSFNAGNDNQVQEGVCPLASSFGSQTLRQFICKPEVDPENTSDYSKLAELIENEELWEVSDEKVCLNAYTTHDFSLFDICQIRFDENCFSNALAYFMEKYPLLWVEFFKSRFGVAIEESFIVSREAVAKIHDDSYNKKNPTGGRIDLLISDSKTFIIIENKIKSDINSTKKEKTAAQANLSNQNQLHRYENFAKYLIKTKEAIAYKAYVLAPDYAKSHLQLEGNFQLLTYGEICEFLQNRQEVLNDCDFLSFYHAMRRHRFENESLCQYDDMKNVFYKRIESYIKTRSKSFQI